jgi:sirohydrochlorin ferrochelatase
MPDPRATSTTTALHLEPTVSDVVDLLERYAAADRELAAELDRIGAEASSSRRVSQATVTQLLRLLEHSLVPGVQAKADLDALPKALRRAGIARWAQQAVDRAQPHPIQGTA